ncbi:1-acyl-sn-glycerol-3-phosphate acyltransferase [Reinekea marinisedimentorum]|uniref:Acyltransferase-like protein n=1 Tax=Reinekea marinisedimentorum TaxID=230495 RepID=A0A4R3IDD3_9GAMM|nr:1-acyl-sn-glycerol-3-phosphate acyltransferase [Reinekea marinisedimentorum]TCS42675.1 acyltransferase-like protein [Reinekea marinisedimentorum]
MFDDIRPYHDDEARSVLTETLNDPEFSKTIAAWLAPGLNIKAPWLVRPLVKWAFKAFTWNVNSIDDFQRKVAFVVRRLLKKSVEEFSVHGLDNLDKNKAYLFVSNHRDIVMDPAMLNWALYLNGFQTVRIAVGDNLLTKPFSSNLMRLNKSFIVKRGLKGMKERLRAAQQLSKYIHFSILDEKANIWIAQREGRAKDGYDRTNSAVIGMFSLSRPKSRSYSDYINELNIVPVAISYELDPLDVAKARELHAQHTKGEYKKSKHEDLNSIARGMTGWKGRVHLEFGDVLTGDFESDEDVAKAIDEQIHGIYKPFETNEWAEKTLKGESPAVANSNVEELVKRVTSARDDIKPYILKQYANGMRMQRGEEPL